MKTAVVNASPICQGKMQGLRDALSILTGKWKFHILGTLMEVEELRFMEILREIEGIGPKMLAKELKDLEMNRLVVRTELKTKPITVIYAISEEGKSLSPIIHELALWGMDYRSKTFKND